LYKYFLGVSSVRKDNSGWFKNRERGHVMKRVLITFLLMCGFAQFSLAMEPIAPYSREKAFITAAEAGDYETMESLIKEAVDLNYKDHPSEGGHTALIKAAKKGHLDCVRLQIDAKVDVNCVSGNGLTALMYAADYGHEDCVRLLLGAQADVRFADSFHQTALTKAVDMGHTNCIQPLIDAKADINLSDLLDRAYGGSFDGTEVTCKLLVEKMLSMPNKEQEQRIYTLLLCLKLNNAEIPGIYSKDIRQIFKNFLHTIIREENAAGVYTHIANLPGMSTIPAMCRIKEDLLNRFSGVLFLAWTQNQ
jgi:hypothetical protein